MYESDLVEEMHKRLFSDPEATKVIGDALRQVMLSDEISLRNSASLGKFIMEYYDLPWNYFGDTHLIDLQVLGYAILASIV